MAIKKIKESYKDDYQADKDSLYECRDLLDEASITISDLLEFIEDHPEIGIFNDSYIKSLESIHDKYISAKSIELHQLIKEIEGWQ